MWIARDKDGYLGLHLLEPSRSSSEWFSRGKYDIENQMINTEVINLSGGDDMALYERFDYIKWEDEPVEVRLIEKNDLSKDSAFVWNRVVDFIGENLSFVDVDDVDDVRNFIDKMKKFVFNETNDEDL